MKSLFFKPKDGWVGDCIPYFDGQSLRVFYLKTRRTGLPFSDIFWHQITTNDFVHFSNPSNTGIEGGTGSILHADGKYHMFYCDNSNAEQQFVCHAISDDLETWTPLGEDTFGADGVIYEKKNWRDPHVFRHEPTNEYWMLLAARTRSGHNRCGCTGLCVSKDLKHWEIRPPFYAPETDVGAHECPDLFQIGDWWYLTYSTYTDFYANVYRMSKSFAGPWQIPVKQTLDGRAFYAGKTARFDGNVYLLGWNPTREAKYYDGWNPKGYVGHDYNVFDWGGSLVVHQLAQKMDGTLSVMLPRSLRHLFSHKRPNLEKEWIGAWNHHQGCYTSASPDFSMLGIGTFSSPSLIAFTVFFTTAMRRCGIALHINEQADQAYYVTLDAQYGHIAFSSPMMQTDEGWRVIPYMAELQQPIALDPGKQYLVEILVDDTIVEIYVNGETALSARMYDRRTWQMALFSLGKGTCFSDIACLYAPDDDRT